MKSIKLSIIILSLLTICCAASVFGQTDRGTIRGTVSDPNGAIVPGARVMITATETGETRETTANDQGDYVFPEVRATIYQISAEATGFQKGVIENFKVDVQTTHTLNIELQIGVETNVVTVDAEAEDLQADTPVRQTNISEQEVKELPLTVSAENGGGRSPLAFIFLDSNVNASEQSGQTNAGRFRVSGGQAEGSEILIDGGATRRQQNGTFATAISPGPNAYQEFTVSTSSYSAEFGNSSGGVVNFTIKSGTNNFHGEAYDILRNEALNSNRIDNIVNNQPRNRDNQNNYGFNVGGPIYVPGFGEGTPAFYKLKDRAFFFFNYEGYRQRLGLNTITTVPSVRMRTGDFSELLTDPYILTVRDNAGNLIFPTGIRIYDPRFAPGLRTMPIPGNRLDLITSIIVVNGVPRPLIDPAGRAILQYYPLPNRTGPSGSTVYQNFAASVIAPNDSNQFTVKTNFNLTSKQTLSFSYSRRINDRLAGGFPILPLPFTTDGVFNQTVHANIGRLQHDYNIAANLLNHLNIGYTYVDSRNKNTTEGFDTSSLGIPANATQNVAFPQILFPATDLNVVQRTESIGSSFFSDRVRDGVLQISDFVTFVTGRQTIKVGADFRFTQLNTRQFLRPGGTFNFRPGQTATAVNDPISGTNIDPSAGFNVASLITGAVQTFNTFNVSIDPAFRQTTQSYFVQDDIKLSNKLTVNLGLRYDLPGARYEGFDRYRGFDPDAINPVIGIRGAIVGADGQGGLPAAIRTLAKTDKSNIGPRFGAAYQLNNKTVVRGGIGLYYAPLLVGDNGQGTLNLGTIGYNTQTASGANATRNALAFLSNFPALTPTDPNNQFVGNLTTSIPFFGDIFRAGRTLQYSVDVQRQLPYKLAVSVGYIGHRADRLRSDFGRLNALPFDALKLGYPILVTNINSVTALQRQYAQSVGITIPANGAAVYAGFNGSVAQALRPFPQYNQIDNITESLGVSNYNALQIKLRRRFAQGIQFGASYTFSRLITNASETVLGDSPSESVLQNPFTAPEDLKAVSPTNSPHVFVANFLLGLPFGKGKAFLNKGGLVSKFVGGFQLQGIFRYQIGTPRVFFFPPERLAQNQSTADFLTLAGYLGNLRPNLTGQPFFLDTAVPSPNIPGRLYVLNPAAFAPPPSYETTTPFLTGGLINPAYAAYYANPNRFFGTAPVVIPEVRGDPFFVEDMSILKKTRITEKVQLEVGAEFFNVFNRVRYLPPGTNLGTPRTIAGSDTGSFVPTNPAALGSAGNGNFGAKGFTSRFDANGENNGPNRIIQLRARIIF